MSKKSDAWAELTGLLTVTITFTDKFEVVCFGYPRAKGPGQRTYQLSPGIRLTFFNITLTNGKSIAVFCSSLVFGKYYVQAETICLVKTGADFRGQWQIHISETLWRQTGGRDPQP